MLFVLNDILVKVLNVFLRTFQGRTPGWLNLVRLQICGDIFCAACLVVLELVDVMRKQKVCRECLVCFNLLDGDAKRAQVQRIKGAY